MASTEYGKRCKNYEQLRVLLSIMRAHKRVTSSMKYNYGSVAHDVIIHRITNLNINCSVAPAQYHFDDFVSKIRALGINVLNIEEEGATVMLFGIVIPTSFLSIKEIIPLLSACTTQNDYNVLYRYVDTVLRHCCGIGVDIFTVSEGELTYDHVIHAVYATLYNLQKAYAYTGNLIMQRKLSEGYPGYIGTMANMFDAVAYNMLKNVDYLTHTAHIDIMSIPKSLRICEMILLLYVIGADTKEHQWLMHFPIFQKVRDLYDTYGLSRSIADSVEYAIFQIAAYEEDNSEANNVLGNLLFIAKLFAITTPITREYTDTELHKFKEVYTLARLIHVNGYRR